MIGKVKWFKKRKYTGRGIAPKTWEGWLYMAFVLILFYIMQVIDMDSMIRTTLTILLAAIVVVDAVDIMRKIDIEQSKEPTSI